MLEIEQPCSGETENQSSKKRKVGEKVVVTVKIQENDKKQKNEGSPSDCWSWRKYGQKPIKGSPHPRGYYRCSTSKGCSAKKQVERSKTDASTLIITYTSTHNHPGPLELELHQKETSPLPLQLTDDDTHQQSTAPKQEEQVQVATTTAEEQVRVQVEAEEDHFQYCQSPIDSTTDHRHIIVNQEENPFDMEAAQSHVLYKEENLFDMEAAQSHVLYKEENLFNMEAAPLSSSFSQDPKNLPSGLKQNENDFYDELEELPTSSFFTAFMRSSFSE